MTEGMTTDSEVPAHAQAVRMARGITAGDVLVLGHDAACASGVEVGRSVVAAAAAVGEMARGVAAGAAIAAAVGEGTGAGAEPGSRLAAVAAGQSRDMRALVPPPGAMRHRKR